MKYTYTAEIELDDDIFTAIEYLNNVVKQAVDCLNSSGIEEIEK